MLIYFINLAIIFFAINEFVYIWFLARIKLILELQSTYDKIQFVQTELIHRF